MKYGLDQATIEKVQRVFRECKEIDSAILYGSRAKGNHKPASDIDLTLEGPLLTMSILNHIRNALDDLNLPYSFDLSILADIENADLMEHIRRVGIVFYSK